MCTRKGKLDGFCENRSTQNCPFLPRSYWCGEGASGRILGKMQAEHPESTFFTNRFSDQWSKLLQKIGGILFIGDSIHSHLAFSLMCSLRDFSNKRKYSFTKIFPYTAKSGGKLYSRVTRKYFCMKTHQSKLICYHRTNVADDVLQRYDFHLKLFSDFGVVVMNFGLHNKQLDTDPIAKLLPRLSKDLSKHKTILIWRETAPQHFDNLGGIFSEDALDHECRDISEASEDLSNQFNLKYNPICEKENITIMKIWNMTKNYFDAHVQGECTHYCQPGIPELWVGVLKEALEPLTKIV